MSNTKKPNKLNQSEDDWTFIALLGRYAEAYVSKTVDDLSKILDEIQAHIAERERIAYEKGWKNAREQSNLPDLKEKL